MKSLSVIAIFLFLHLFLSCAGRRQEVVQPTATPKQNKPEIKLTSTSFKDGESIPRPYTCDGVNISPSLEWSGVPKTAKTVAIVCDDPDAPGGTWVHWVLYNLPAENIGLVENLSGTENLKAGGFQGQKIVKDRKSVV